MFNRVPEGAGHKFWFNLAKKQGLNTSQVAQQMLNSAPAQEYFAGKNSNEDFVNHIYSNLFGKTIAQDPKGSKFWIDKLKEGNSKAFVVSEMLKAAMSNTYTKPEELKAQKLFLNKLKAAEIAHKAIENVPSSGSITEKIASFANILKNIKDTSTPTQIAQVIKQEALKGNLTVLNSHQLAQITKSIFPSVDADALQKALDNTTATTDIYEEGGSTPTPPTPLFHDDNFTAPPSDKPAEPHTSCGHRKHPDAPYPGSMHAWRSGLTRLGRSLITLQPAPGRARRTLRWVAAIALGLIRKRMVASMPLRR